MLSLLYRKGNLTKVCRGLYGPATSSKVEDVAPKTNEVEVGLLSHQVAQLEESYFLALKKIEELETVVAHQEQQLYSQAGYVEELKQSAYQRAFEKAKEDLLERLLELGTPPQTKEEKEEPENEEGTSCVVPPFSATTT